MSVVNVIRIPNLQQKGWNKHSYNVISSTKDENPYGISSEVISFVHKKSRPVSYCFCYQRKSAPMKRNQTYRCTIWAKTKDPSWKIQMYTANNKQRGRLWGEVISVTPSDTWQQLTWIFTNSSNSNADCISFKLHGSDLSTRYRHSLYGPVLEEYTEKEELLNLDAKEVPKGTETENQADALHSQSFSNIYDKYINAIVKVMIESQDGQVYNGSGFFISSDGYIATAGHCIVAGNSAPEPFAKKVWINIYPDNKVMEAKIIGVDRLYDVGLVKVNVTNRTYLKWHDSRDVKIGSYAVTIGHPLGDHVQSISSGMVSENKGQDYSWMPESVLVGFSIIGGNSGGPVLDKDGKVIGIVSWGYDVGNFSLNGAVSSYVAYKIIQDFLERHDKEEKTPMVYRTGYIGIYFRPIGMYESIQMNLNVVQGMQVISVAPKSPAEKAGIQIGDVIVRADGKNLGKFNNQELLGSIIHFKLVGEGIDLTIIRNNKELNVTVLSETLPPKNDYIFANTHTIQKLMKKEITLHC